MQVFPGENAMLWPESSHFKQSLAILDSIHLLLTSWGPVTHIYIGKMGHHWLMHWKAYRIFGTKPLPEPMFTYRQLYPNKLQWNYSCNQNLFIQGNANQNGVCKLPSISFITWPVWAIFQGNEVTSLFSVVVMSKTFKFLWLSYRRHQNAQSNPASCSSIDK